MPSSKRPPLSRSSVAAALANTAGGLSGRVPTAGKTRAGPGVRGDRAEQRQRVEVPWLVGVVLNADQVVAEAVDHSRGLDHAERIACLGGWEVHVFDDWA